MTNYPQDLTGLRFGRLVVLSLFEKKFGRWLCKCDCGETRIIYRSNLTTGQSTSCGCYQREISTTHGLSKTHLFGVWWDMRRRCNDPNRPAYKDYGGRGIKVCAEWDEFINFHEWSIKNGYKKGLTLDRINNNEGYSPDNCRWVNRLVQNNNTRKNIFITIDGVTLSVSQFAKKYNIDPNTIKYRMQKGFTGKELIAPPYSNQRKRGNAL